jgi:hypothetical protein
VAHEQATTIESKAILLGPPPNPFLSTNFHRTTEVLEVQCSTKSAAQVLLQHLAHENIGRISVCAANFALPEQKRVGKTCLPYLLSTYVPCTRELLGSASQWT